MSSNVHLSRQRIQDLMVGALEGGSNYWCFFPDLSAVPRDAKGPIALRITEAVWEDGASIPVADSEDGKIVGQLTKSGMTSALGKMAEDERHPGVVGAARRIRSGDDDASDADVWFQFATMNAVVYG